MAFGTLERSKGTQPMSDINVTPLVDVMLVLLVIFIITAPLMVSTLKLDLPKTDAAQQSDEPNFVSIAIEPSGKLYLNDKPTTPAALALHLQERAQEKPDTEVQLHADNSVPYGRVVEVMGMAQKVGLKRIGFVAAPEDKTPGTAPAAPAAGPADAKDAASINTAVPAAASADGAISAAPAATDGTRAANALTSQQ